ncbi:peptidase M16 [Niastella yeongjuensis]|uniref:Peptidase M16 n=1 Tax=Niastella yeongjuensis TaxID=354355 RepID=A0A1V9EF10_9BACT|nr:insulinase family protein [Niastella yeongjuensis]OQP44515.1 peptidase M16 [Niastella yeongjuensis]SEO85010.1 zinc protease [Niastella yeongjuensis]
MLTLHSARRSLPLVVLIAASTWQARAQSLPLDPAVRTGKLPNGFTYFIRHNAEPAKRVVFYLANKVGSMQEEDNQRGLAHFMEHMSFNGTKHYPKNELVNYLQKSGVRFGADLNAYTGFNETVYQLPLPADDTSIVRNGLQIMRDWAGEATLETEEINKERGVVLEEKRLRNGAKQRLQDQTFPVSVNGSRYASRLPIGTEEVLNNFKPDVVKRFYKDWYRPDLQALIVVGDIDVNSMEQQIKMLFGDLKNPAKERSKLTYNIPLTGKNQFRALTDPEQTTTTIEILIKQPESTLKTSTDYRNSIIRTLYNAVLAERFRELLVQPDPPFISAQAGIQGFMGGLDAYSVSISPKPGKMAEAFSIVYTELLRMQKHGITNSELERGKLAYLTGFENAYKESSKTPSRSYVQEYLQYFLNEIAAPGMEVEYKLAKEFVGNITLTEINAFAAKAMQETNRDIIITAPEKDKNSLPAETVVNGWITKVESDKLSPRKETVNPSGLLKTMPLAGKVVKQERADSVGAIKYTLSNGITVWVKPTDFKNDEILFGAFSEGGTSIYSDKDFLNASNATLIAANGVGDFAPVELGKFMTGKAAQVQPWVQERYEGFNGAAVSKDLETALQLLYLYFTAPRKDLLIFKNIISRTKAGMANRLNNPEAVFADSVNLVLGNYHYRRKPIATDQVDSIDPDKIYDIYRELFANAGGFTFVFTGSIDTAAFIPLIEKYLGSLPVTGKTATTKDLGIRIPDGVINKTFYKGKDNKATVRLYYSGVYQFSAVNNIQLSALGTILQYRMIERIRELEGGAYTPQAGVNYGKLPQSRYTFHIQFTCAPGNVEKLVAAANEEIKKIKSSGVSADDITKFAAEQTRGNETQLRSNRFWLSYLIYALQNEEPATGVYRLTELLKQVTTATVQQTAKQYINDKNYIKLVLMPETTN